MTPSAVVVWGTPTAGPAATWAEWCVRSVACLPGMPELPEVETARRNLERWAHGRRIIAIHAADTRVLRPAGKRGLSALTGATFDRFDRRGKHLLLTLNTEKRGALGLWSHLGMTGKWVIRERAQEAPRLSRAAFALDSGRTLHYVDPRMFGRLVVVPAAKFDGLEAVAHLGPDALNDRPGADALRDALGRGPTPVKVALMDQMRVAGLGNIQASEALFRARLDPRRPVSSLTRADLQRLARGIQSSLAFTLASLRPVAADADVVYVEDAEAPNPFWVYRRAGQRCRRCRSGIVQRIVQAQRSTFFCPACLPRPIAAPRPRGISPANRISRAGSAREPSRTPRASGVRLAPNLFPESEGGSTAYEIGRGIRSDGLKSPK